MPLIDSKSWKDGQATHQVHIYQCVTDLRYFVQDTIYQNGGSQGILNTPYKSITGARKAFENVNGACD